MLSGLAFVLYNLVWFEDGDIPECNCKQTQVDLVLRLDHLDFVDIFDLVGHLDQRRRLAHILYTYVATQLEPRHPINVIHKLRRLHVVNNLGTILGHIYRSLKTNLRI